MNFLECLPVMHTVFVGSLATLMVLGVVNLLLLCRTLKREQASEKSSKKVS